MFTTSILMAATLASAVPAGPKEQASRPPQQFESLEELFDSQTGTWTNASLVSPAMVETEREDVAADSLYKPIVRETLRTPPPPRPAGLYFFGITR